MNNFNPMMMPQIPVEISFWDSLLFSLNNNKYIFAMLMMVLNMGARYIDMDFTDIHRSALSSKIIRRLVIFTICFMATRDIVVSILLTAAFIIIVLNLFNVNSEYCVLPDSWKSIDTNKDGQISPKEIEAAYISLKKQGKL